MFSHVMLGADDVAASRGFYDATLGALGVRPGREDDKRRIFYRGVGGVFGVGRPIDGAGACAANGGTVGFSAASPEAVEAWHEAGLAHGGTACENPPGIREGMGVKLYLAYLRDPAGNKLCALYRMPG
jgi:catechol 2,3-dioxygenase-like lactoylglutathione lyase family enzyme